MQYRRVVLAPFAAAPDKPAEACEMMAILVASNPKGNVRVYEVEEKEWRQNPKSGGMEQVPVIRYHSFFQVNVDTVGEVWMRMFMSANKEAVILAAKNWTPELALQD